MILKYDVELIPNLYIVVNNMWLENHGLLCYNTEESVPSNTVTTDNSSIPQLRNLQQIINGKDGSEGNDRETPREGNDGHGRHISTT